MRFQLIRSCQLNIVHIDLSLDYVFLQSYDFLYSLMIFRDDISLKLNKVSIVNQQLKAF